MTHLPDTAAATRPEPSEVTQQRIGVLDVARGIAILGTLATNIWIFTDPGGIIGYLERPLTSLTGGLEQTVQTITRQLANGKFLGMLTLMFGVGLELQRRSARRRGRPWPGRYPWRASLLFLDGLLHYLLVVEFDILNGLCRDGGGGSCSAGHLAPEPADLAVDRGEPAHAAAVRRHRRLAALGNRG
jgi:uncharacterized protein